MDKVEFNSPLGRLAFAQKHALNGNNPKIIGIPDESGESGENKREIVSNLTAESTDKEDWNQIAELVDDQKALREKVENLRNKSTQNSLRINEKNKEKVEVLLNLRKKVIEVPIGDMVFKISTLKRKQSQELSLSLLNKRESTQNDLDLTFQLMNETLARAIVEISDLDTTLGKFISFKDFLGVETEAEIVPYIEEFEDDVVDFLYNKYLELKKDIAIEKPEEIVSEIKK